MLDYIKFSLSQVNNDIIVSLVLYISACVRAPKEDGARFQKHVDNPNRDGRILTSIVPW